MQRERAEAWTTLHQFDEGSTWAAADALFVALAGDRMTAAERELFARPWLDTVADDLLAASCVIPGQRVSSR